MHQANDRVVSHDGKTFKAGTTGTVTEVGMIDSETYVHVLTDAGLPIGPSLDACWQAA